MTISGARMDVVIHLSDTRAELAGQRLATLKSCSFDMNTSENTSTRIYTTTSAFLLELSTIFNGGGQ